MFKVLVPAVAALGLVAFAASTQSADIDTAVSTVEPVASAPVAWHLSHDGEVAKLAYGASNSDLIALMVTCAAGATDVAVYGDMRPIAANLIETSGPAMPDPLSGGAASETVMPLADAGLRDLADKGRMAVKGGEETFQLAATQQERRVVGRFLSYCETGRA